jgi:hypothetical protein
MSTGLLVVAVLTIPKLTFAPASDRRLGVVTVVAVGAAELLYDVVVYDGAVT